MKMRMVLVPRSQLSYYQIGFESVERTLSGTYIRTTKTMAIDPVASTVTKEVIDGEEYPQIDGYCV